MAQFTLEGRYTRSSDSKEFSYEATYEDGWRPPWSAQVYSGGEFLGGIGGTVLNLDPPPDVLRRIVEELVRTSIERNVGISA